MIIVKGRELLIPENERYIGTTYDDNSTVRTFRISRFHEDGMDKSQLDFYVIINYDDGSDPDAVGVVKSVSDDYIVLELDVGEDVTDHPGCLYLWVRGFDHTGTVRWSSFPGVFYIEGSGTAPTDLSDLEQRIAQEDKFIRLAKLYRGHPMTAATAAEMVNRDQIYVYIGNEAGYNYGYWYFWNGSAWTPGGVYNAVAVHTDNDLIAEGVAADARAAGEKLIHRYDTVAQMKADTTLGTGMYARTGGYYAVNDGGGALYRIYSTAPGTHYETLSNGLYARLITEDFVTPKMFGAYGDGTHDDTQAITKALGFNPGVVYFPEGEYLLSSDVTVLNIEKLEIFGEGSKSKILKYGFILTCKEQVQNLGNVAENNICIHDLSFIGAYGVGSRSIAYRGIHITGGAFTEIYGCYLEGFMVGIYVGHVLSTYIHDNQLYNCGDCNHSGKSWTIAGGGDDAYGDGIYVHHSAQTYYGDTFVKSVVTIERNKINNDVSVSSQQYGRCGIVLEFGNYNTEVKNNIISGYTRGIHCEYDLENGNNNIEANCFYGCTTGIMLWNVLGHYNIESNMFYNYGFNQAKLTGMYGFQKVTVNSATRIAGFCIYFPSGSQHGRKCNIRYNRSICSEYSASSLLLGGMTSGADAIFMKNGTKYSTWGVSGEICHNHFDSGVPNTIISTDADTIYCADSNIHDNFISGWRSVCFVLAVNNEDTYFEHNTIIMHGNADNGPFSYIRKVPLSYGGGQNYFKDDGYDLPHVIIIKENMYCYDYYDHKPAYLYRGDFSPVTFTDVVKYIKNKFMVLSPNYTGASRGVYVRVASSQYTKQIEYSGNEVIGNMIDGVSMEQTGVNGGFAIHEPNLLNGKIIRQRSTDIIDGTTITDTILAALHPVIGDMISTYDGHMYYVTGDWSENTPFTYEQRY